MSTPLVSNDKLIHDIDNYVGITQEIRRQNDKYLALTEPAEYNKAYGEALTKLKDAAHKFVVTKRSELAGTYAGLPEEEINRLVANEAVSRYNNEIQAINEQFPYRNLATQQKLIENKPKIAPTTRRAAPKRRKAAPKRKKAATKPKRRR